MLSDLLSQSPRARRVPGPRQAVRTSLVAPCEGALVPASGQVDGFSASELADGDESYQEVRSVLESKMQFGTLAALVAALVLALLAALHIYWGFGGRWPGSDERSLAETVVGVTPDGRMPGPGACLVVALLLAVAAALPLIVRSPLPLPLPLPLWMPRIALWVATGVLAFRGLGGYLDRRLRPGIVGLPYDRLNRRLYSPLCLALAGLLAASLLV